MIKQVIFSLTAVLLFSCGPAEKEIKIVEKPKVDAKPVIEQKPIEAPKIMTEATLDLTRYGIANSRNNVLGGLKVGDLAPDIELENEQGKLVSLDKKLETGPVLLVFYRADWCSYCVKHLQEFQDQIRDIWAAGRVKVMAVSPQKQEYSKKLDQEHMFAFPILHDIHHQTMKDYKVFFHVTDKYNDYIKEAKGGSIEFWNGNQEPVMPVPATYMIGQDKRIKYVHYDPDYKKRADIQEALKSIAVSG